ncbi:hypothetical protein GCM10025795_03770 [Verticiella sediminum]
MRASEPDPAHGLYAAFNMSRLALVAPCDAPPSPDAQRLPVPPGSAFRQELGELTYEKRQRGANAAGHERILYAVRFNVPDTWTDEFDRWYEEEHIPMIYGCRHWAMTRRYRLHRAGEGDASHLALHYLSDAGGLDAPELQAARQTPWRKKFLEQDWFTAVDKIVYFRLGTA